MSTSERFVKAAMEFCRLDSELAAMRGKWRRCTEYDSGEPEIGDYGVPRCHDSAQPAEEWCENCRANIALADRGRDLKRLRYLARRKMRRCVVRVEVPEENQPVAARIGERQDRAASGN